MNVREINEFSDFLALKDEWKVLLARCSHSVFSTWEWLTVWWRHFGSDRRLMLLIAEENGKILGIAPLMYSVHKALGARQGKIEFIGTPESDYNDFIIVDRTEECMKLFARYLKSVTEKWNCIELRGIPARAKSLEALSKISKTLKPVDECYCTVFPDTFTMLLNTLTHKFRNNLRRSSRLLEKDGLKLEVLDCSQSDSYSKGMCAFFELHRKRWASKRFAGVFAEKRTRDFHLEVGKVFAQEKWLGLYLLTVSDKPVAGLYGYKYQLKCYVYSTGFDPRYYKYSPGNLLSAHVMSKCIQEGMVEFDFLRGGEAYKARWNAVSRWTYKAIILKTGFSGGLSNRLFTMLWNQRDRLRRLKCFLEI